MISKSDKRNFATKHPIGKGCWVWNAGNNGSYGKYYSSSLCKNISAHRFSYLIHNGELENGKVIMHKCDTPLCVNPSHLVQGTYKENLDDCKLKGRFSKDTELKEYRRRAVKKWAKLTEKDIPVIRNRILKGDYYKDIAGDYGVTLANISAIANNRSWVGV